MATVRRRRQDRKEVPTSKTDKKSVALIRNAAAEMLKRFLSSSILHFLVGATICVYLGAKWGMQMRQFHENDMFFSEIKVADVATLQFSRISVRFFFFVAGSRARDILSNRSGFVLFLLQGARSGENVDGGSVRISIRIRNDLFCD